MPGSGPGKRILIWVTDETWRAAIDAVADLAPEPSSVTLLHVTPSDPPDVAHAAYLGLLGRGPAGRDPRARIADISASSAAELLDAAAGRLGRPCERIARTGRVEREVVAAAEGADLLIMARDGDRSRLGPKSLGKDSRFALDHAPCPVLLVWPEPAPTVGTIPPPPPPGAPPPGAPPGGPPPPPHPRLRPPRTPR
ncbi:MAG TPA: universal stress protein [Streptosporangiaceae bacterium]|nr:universal stress protein [Streptosporangiaceae bacterium]